MLLATTPQNLGASRVMNFPNMIFSLILSGKWLVADGSAALATVMRTPKGRRLGRMDRIVVAFEIRPTLVDTFLAAQSTAPERQVLWGIGCMYGTYHFIRGRAI